MTDLMKSCAFRVHRYFIKYKPRICLVVSPQTEREKQILYNFDQTAVLENIKQASGSIFLFSSRLLIVLEILAKKTIFCYILVVIS